MNPIMENNSWPLGRASSSASGLDSASAADLASTNLNFLNGFARCVPRESVAGVAMQAVQPHPTSRATSCSGSPELKRYSCHVDEPGIVAACKQRGWLPPSFDIKKTSAIAIRRRANTATAAEAFRASFRALWVLANVID